jgi:hypothetical protein
MDLQTIKIAMLTDLIFSPGFPSITLGAANPVIAAEVIGKLSINYKWLQISVIFFQLEVNSGALQECVFSESDILRFEDNAMIL